MDWQTAAVVLLMAWAVAYLVRSAWRARTGCGGGCGCTKKPVPQSKGQAVWIPQEKLTMRRREGDT
jgi:hypothetical protein